MQQLLARGARARRDGAGLLWRGGGRNVRDHEKREKG